MGININNMWTTWEENLEWKEKLSGQQEKSNSLERIKKKTRWSTWNLGWIETLIGEKTKFGININILCGLLQQAKSELNIQIK